MKIRWKKSWTRLCDESVAVQSYGDTYYLTLQIAVHPDCPYDEIDGDTCWQNVEGQWEK